MDRIKHLILDLVGLTLILVSPLLGWLPGPGGIPLLVAGLGLLAINHEWANKLLVYIKTNGLIVSKFVFRDHPSVQAAYDIITISFVIGGIYLINTYTQSLTLALAVFLLFTSFALFVGNRQRLERFSRWIKRSLRPRL